MKKIVTLFLTVVMCCAMCTCTKASTGPVSVVNVPEKDAKIDGIISPGEWDESTSLTLNISDTTKWTQDEMGNPPFIGNIMPPEDHTDDDFTNRIKLSYKDGYLYYCEERIDSTPYYLSDSPYHPYCQDSSLVWFILPTGARHSLSVFADNDESGPFIVLNKNDDQENGQWLDCEIVSTLKENGHMIEAKIPIGVLDITEDMLDKNKVKITYATVNIFDYDFDGNNETLADGWGIYGYEGWYKGVTNWAGSPRIILTEAMIYGDVDGNKIVDSSDALQILQNSISKLSFSADQEKRGDVDLDTVITSSDALFTLQFSISLLKSLPIYR